MNREEAINFGEMWLELQEDSQDSNTYEFFKFAVEALKQTAAEPMVEIDLYSLVNQTYVKREVLDKIKAEITELDDELCQHPVIDDADHEVHRAYTECIYIIDKYRILGR